MQFQQLQSVVPLTAANGDTGQEIVKPNSRVLLPIELGDAFADLDPLWQWRRANETAEALRTMEFVVIVVKGFPFALAIEPARFTLHASCVDPVLS
jgi:hypothetical protein